MPDDREAEPPPGSPGQRALGAMESAVRRARAAAGDAPLPPPPPPSYAWPRTRPPDAVPPSANGRPPGRADRWLIGSVAVVAALVVVAAIALVVSVTSSPSLPSPTAAGTAGRGTAASSSTVPSPPSSTRPESGRGNGATTSTTVAAAAGGPPIIASLSPASGPAGQAVVVTGSNFLSSSGQIVATFNGQVATTSCPAPNTCNVTAPPSATPSAQVAITTASGTSNAVTFTYG
jgi:IPT/TIG domain